MPELRVPDFAFARSGDGDGVVSTKSSSMSTASKPLGLGTGRVGCGDLGTCAGCVDFGAGGGSGVLGTGGGRTVCCKKAAVALFHRRPLLSVRLRRAGTAGRLTSGSVSGSAVAIVTSGSPDDPAAVEEAGAPPPSGARVTGGVAGLMSGVAGAVVTEASAIGTSLFARQAIIKSLNVLRHSSSVMTRGDVGRDPIG